MHQDSTTPVSRKLFSRRQLLKDVPLGGAALAGVALLGPLPAPHAEAGMRVAEADRLRKAMRKLWEDHITWTRLFIVSAAAGLPDVGPTTQRLLQNQSDLGDAIKPFYGEAAGNQLTALLKDHIVTAAELVMAAKANDTAKVNDARRRWYANAEQIANFLSSANPTNWPAEAMRAMMREHLDLTLAEALARLRGDFAADIAAYDEVHRQILAMADMLAEGIIAQFFPLSPFPFPFP